MINQKFKKQVLRSLNSKAPLSIDFMTDLLHSHLDELCFNPQTSTNSNLLKFLKSNILERMSEETHSEAKTLGYLL